MRTHVVGIDAGTRNLGFAICSFVGSGELPERASTHSVCVLKSFDLREYGMEAVPMPSLLSVGTATRVFFREVILPSVQDALTRGDRVCIVLEKLVANVNAGRPGHVHKIIRECAVELNIDLVQVQILSIARRALSSIQGRRPRKNAAMGATAEVLQLIGRLDLLDDFQSMPKSGIGKCDDPADAFLLCLFADLPGRSRPAYSGRIFKAIARSRLYDDARFM